MLLFKDFEQLLLEKEIVPYQWQFEKSDPLVWSYIFKDDQGDSYLVEFTKEESGIWEVKFYIKDGTEWSVTKMTGKGNLSNITKTILGNGEIISESESLLLEELKLILGG
jgi:hypothetical protein